MIDLTAPKYVEVVIDKPGKIVWVNVDGICRLRCCQVDEIHLTDDRPKKKARNKNG